MNPIFSIVTLAVLVALIDLPYLLLNANKYATITKSISGAGYTERYYSVALVYIAIASGLYFLVLPQIKNKSDNTNTALKNALLFGGIFGVSSYAIFDFTTHFMFKNWDLMTSIIDCVWGGVLCGLASIVYAYLLM